MRTLYSEPNITFSVERHTFKAIHMILEQLTKKSPLIVTEKAVMKFIMFHPDTERHVLTAFHMKLFPTLFM